MGDVVAEVCGAICGGLALATVASINAWCVTIPGGLTVCKCCDSLCRCGCCWKGDKGQLPEEDYPGGSNHPDTIAAAQALADRNAAKQAQGEEGGGGEEEGVAPPAYDPKARSGSSDVARTTQPTAQPGMVISNPDVAGTS
ncbi:hypothetical protein CF319_g5241 [Tilletia indica]|nr:hypothetical protein CF319_g5241 [Tilletia indica]